MLTSIGMYHYNVIKKIYVSNSPLFFIHQFATHSTNSICVISNIKSIFSNETKWFKREIIIVICSIIENNFNSQIFSRIILFFVDFYPYFPSNFIKVIIIIHTVCRLEWQTFQESSIFYYTTFSYYYCWYDVNIVKRIESTYRKYFYESYCRIIIWSPMKNIKGNFMLSS